VPPPAPAAKSHNHVALLGVVEQVAGQEAVHAQRGNGHDDGREAAHVVEQAELFHPQVVGRVDDHDHRNAQVDDPLHEQPGSIGKILPEAIGLEQGMIFNQGHHQGAYQLHKR
jgi:hypothetical protein